MDRFNFIKRTLMSLNFASLVEILIVAYLLYKLYWLIRETRAEQLLKGMLIILALIPISGILQLTMLYTILSRTITVGVLSLVIIFQPEIRRALEHIGRSAFSDRHTLVERSLERLVTEIVTAVDSMSTQKTGALIALEQNTGLSDIISSGTTVDAKVSSALIENIFVPNTPLHDGAMIIRDDRIIAAGCLLPLTNTAEISKKIGTRHRAAIGLTEISDAAVIIVSEETGIISLALNGKLVRNYDKERLKAILIKILSKNQNEEKSTIGERVKGWVNSRKTTSL